MGLLTIAGACDSHSHVFGPFDRYPLAAKRSFNPPESPLEALEGVWSSLGLEKSVLIQGSAHGEDHSAMLAAIASDREHRRGVALIASEISDASLNALHQGGIRAIRFNWTRHLLGDDARSVQQRLDQASALLSRIHRMGWHVELHVDATNLGLVENLLTPDGMPVVIDHMARIDLRDVDAYAQLSRLISLLKHKHFWVKLSGADRMAANLTELDQCTSVLQQLLVAAPDRCVWGLDWPHVNLYRKRTDEELVRLLMTAAQDREALRRILCTNPDRLYGSASEAPTLQTEPCLQGGGER